MVLLGEVAEHAMDRVLVRVRAELQELVVVDEFLAHGRIPLAGGYRPDAERT
jgi:hypothetical protein